jgi:fluoride exporter
MMIFNFLLVNIGNIWRLFTAIDPNIRIPIAISLGAIPGALSRYYITKLTVQWLGTNFPYGTFFINLTGAFIMGFFVTFTLDRWVVSPDLRLLVTVGFLGSYTTFSTYALDTKSLLATGNYQLSLFYWAGSAILGVVGVQFGSWLASKI